MKKTAALLKLFLCFTLAVAIMLTASACEDKDETDYSNSTVNGIVTEIDGNNVTVTVFDTNGIGRIPNEMGRQNADGMPEDIQKPGDEIPEGMEQSGDGMPEDMQKPGDEIPEGMEQPGDRNMPEDMQQPNGDMLNAAGGETATFNLKNAEIKKFENSDSGMIEVESSVKDIEVGNMLSITLGEKNKVESVTIMSGNFGGGESGMGGFGGNGGFDGNGGFGGFGGSNEVTQGDSANTITEAGEYNGSYVSSGNDENALRVDGASVTLDSITVEKTGGTSSNTENGDFYGMNAALLATNGATVTIKNANISSSAQNGNGVFSYGSGTTVNISDSTINTTADNSGGIQTTGGGTTNASNLNITTAGNSSAAIRSDRGGGTVNVDGGTYESNGYNSPAVYSTADITVKNSVLTANNSEALVIEGKNSIVLENCQVTGNMSSDKGTSSDENVHNVMIYQSMSGDADVGTSVFTMTGGTLTSQNGDMFFVTNTHSIITLSGVDITNNGAEDSYLMLISGNSASRGWGTAGKNGAQVELIADGQTLEGAIAVDSISTLDITLKNGSTLVGTINIIENAQGGTAVENNAVVTIEEGCTWTLTGDCIITALTNNGIIDENGYTLTVLNQ